MIMVKPAGAEEKSGWENWLWNQGDLILGRHFQLCRQGGLPSEQPGVLP